MPPVVKILEEKLAGMGLLREINWPGKHFTEYYAQTKPFLLKMYHERDSFIQEMADQVWKPFIESRPLIEEANKALAEQYRSTSS